MKFKIILIAFLAVTLLCLPAVRAQQTNGNENRSAPAGPTLPNNARFGIPSGIARIYQNYLYGVITKTGPDGLVLDKTKFGVPQTIQVNKKTKYIRNGKHSTLKALKPGDQIYVDVKMNKKTGTMLAKKVISGIGATGGPS
ncbi:MAG: hypothetical protein ACRD2B_10280 [Terriglobia bacterium]